MIPGTNTICSVAPQVRLAIKMQKLDLKQFYAYNNEDFLGFLPTIGNYANPRTGNFQPVCQKVVELFAIFLKKEFDYEQVLQGVKNAGKAIKIARINRTANKTSMTVSETFYEKQVFKNKIRKIYVRREVPAFSQKTHGKLKFITVPKILDEKDSADFRSSCSPHQIVVFRFRDKNGRVSLNFYAPKSRRRYY